MTEIRTLISAAATRLSLVPGTSVQLYTEPRLLEALQSTFDLVFRKPGTWWDEYMAWGTFTLSGTTGLPTETVTLLKKFNDIRVAFAEGSNLRLKRVPNGINPFLLEGTTPKYIDPYTDAANKVFRCFPVTATGSVILHYRKHPGDRFTLDDEINLDEEMMILGAVWDVLQSDGSNPGETDKAGRLFNKRFEDMRANQSNLPDDLDSRVFAVPTTWMEPGDG